MIKHAEQADDGMVELVFTLPPGAVAGAVSVVGDFNDWNPYAHPMTREEDGSRTAVVWVPEGSTICFRYLAEGGRWFDDPEVRERDHRGAIVHVPQPAAAPKAARAKGAGEPKIMAK
ncbi:isoamylase early set domain-containing protein [Streptosporangium sp. KLBMP 9127]|nr:isoamylase early set domain-containing protein [Streptosporangium sp. KLBMP 9127]